MIVKREPKSPRHRACGYQRLCEALESRQLFAATVSANIPPILAHPSSASTDSVTLSNFIDDPNINGTVVTFDTTAGDISVALTDTATPITVQNFLSYVTSNAYNDTFFHRNFVFATNSGGSPTAPADIVQGGGYIVSNGSVNHITTQAPIQDEYTQELFGDVAGTIAMAKTTDANSATSEFFFNVHDNSSVLDVPTTDSNGVQTSYTVFGRVLGNGMNVLNTLAALPTEDLSSVNSALATLPVTGDTTNGVTPSNLEYINTATIVPAFKYTVTSDNLALVQPAVSGNTLSFTYGAGASGVADITVVAADADGVSSVTQNFAITVPDTTQPTQGPTAKPDTAPDLLHDTTGSFHPLANDTDSLSPLLPSTLSIVTQPGHGTASVDPSTGYVTYVPAAGYIGADTFQYTVADQSGQTSASATVTINVTPDPFQVTIGGTTGKNLVYTQPDGTVATLAVTGGSAVVTFFNYNVQTTTSGSSIVATGPGATVENVAVTNTSTLATFSLTSKGGTPTLGGISDPTGYFSSINAPTAVLTGTIDVATALKLTLGSANDADIEIKMHDANAVGITSKLFSIGTATNTSVTFPSTLAIDAIKCNQWLDPEGGHTITAASLVSLQATGEFDDRLTLTNPSPFGFTAKIGKIGGGAWSVTGLVHSVTAKSVDPSWSLSTNNLVLTMNLGGDFSGRIDAGAIRNLTIGGNLSNAVVETDAGWTASFIQLANLKVHGKITDSQIVAQGNIGNVTATAMSGSSILAGLGSTIIQSTGLPTSSSDFTALGATIHSVNLGAKGTFDTSRIAAGVVDSLKIGAVTTSNGGTAFGIAAGKMGSISCSLDGKTKLALGPAQLSNAFVLKSYEETKKLTGFNDFNITFLT